MGGNRKFGNHIRSLREAKKKEDPSFSLRKFAEAVGISPTFLSKIETGEFAPPSAENIIKMAKLLGVDPDDLLALANKMDPDLSDFIKEKQKVMADFLRTARDAGLSEDDLRAITERIRRRKN